MSQDKLPEEVEESWELIDSNSAKNPEAVANTLSQVDISPPKSTFSFNPDAAEWVPPGQQVSTKPETVVQEPEGEPRDKGKDEIHEKPAVETSTEPKEVPTTHIELDETPAETLEDLPDEIKQQKLLKHVNLVFIGHVDAGKSTLGGRIMHLTGQLDDRMLEKFEREAKQKNRESWKYAWALDSTEVEREKGKTVECGRAHFHTEHKSFTLLDAPGHKGFIPFMIGGAAQADVGVLVISGRKGEFETGFERGGQTREHAMLAKTVGVRQLIVAITKMDDSTVMWSEERYNECVTALIPYLKQVGYNPKKEITFIPVSGFSGANVKDIVAPEVCKWYKGESLLDILDGLKPPSRIAGQAPRMPIHDKYKEMGTVVMGKLQSGTIKKDQKLMLSPGNIPVKVASVMIDSFEIDEAEPGDSIRVKLAGAEDADLQIGDVLCDPSEPVHVAKVFDAQVIILEYKSIITVGYSAVLHIHAAIQELTIEKLLAVVDKKTNKVTQKHPKFVKAGQTIRARFSVDRPICMEKFKDFQQLGRFMMRDEGKTVGVGVITKLYEFSESQPSTSKK